MTGVAAIVLAAGASRRHGSPKQLRRIAGKALVRRAADAASASGFRPCVVVLGASAAAIAPELAGSEADVIVNAAWSEGMASSLRSGLSRVRSIAPSAQGVIVILADQPHVGEELLRSLADRFAAGPESVVACRYEGVLGPPVIFARTFFGRLETLTGDEGARALLRSGDVRVAAVDFPEGALDVDTPEVRTFPPD